MSTNPFKDNMICDLGTIKAQTQLPISMSTPITCESQTAANTKLTRPRRRSRSKVVTGFPKSLCLPRLCDLENIASVLIVRQESPWDTYQKVITYEIAGKVTIATRRTRPSRMVAIRTYRKENARRLINRFGRLEHGNVLSLHECYMHEDLAFLLVDDLPLTLAHVVAFPSVYPSEAELGSIICQVCPSWTFRWTCPDVLDPRRCPIFSVIWPYASSSRLWWYITWYWRDHQDRFVDGPILALSD